MTNTNRNEPSSWQTKYNLLAASLNISLQKISPQRKVTEILSFLCSPNGPIPAVQAALFSVEKKNIVFVAGCNFDKEDQCRNLFAGVCHCGVVAQEGRTKFFPLNPSSAPSQCCKEPHYCIPIANGKGAPQGVLALQYVDSHQYSRENQEFFENIATILGTILSKKQAEEKLAKANTSLSNSLAAIKEEKTFSDAIIHAMPNGLLVTGDAGQIIQANQAAENILLSIGIRSSSSSIQDIFGHGTRSQQHPTEPQKPQVQEDVFAFSKTDGGKISIAFSTVPLKNAQGEETGQIISLSDITDSLHNNSEIDKMNKLSTIAEIASAVAHEVRNPLAGIKIMAQSIEDEVDENSEQHECAKRITRQVDRLNKLLGDFFTYARPGTPEISSTNIRSAIQETFHLIHKKLSKSKIDFHFNPTKKVPNILVDANQLQQVLLNLFLNSIDAIKQNGKISIYTEEISPISAKSYTKQFQGLTAVPGDVLLRFIDDGCGIPEETLQQIFEPFYTTKSSGTGLGLATVYRTLKENNAHVYVESAPGQGTIFSIFFKRAH